MSETENGVFARAADGDWLDGYGSGMRILEGGGEDQASHKSPFRTGATVGLPTGAAAANSQRKSKVKQTSTPSIT